MGNVVGGGGGSKWMRFKRGDLGPIDYNSVFYKFTSFQKTWKPLRKHLHIFYKRSSFVYPDECLLPFIV